MRIGIIGRSELALNSAQMLRDAGHPIAFVYTCKGEANYEVQAEDFQRFAEASGAAFYNDLQLMKRIDELAATGAEICVSVNWLTLLREPLMSRFPHGVINAHAGDLPRYRGNACPNWAILNQEKELGLSIHEMSEELDAGPVLLKRFFPLSDDTYVNDIYVWLRQAIPQAFLDAVNGLQAGTITPVPQDSAIRPLRAFPRKPQDARISWSNDVSAILRLVRASSRPFAGAFCLDEEGRTVRIFRAVRHVPHYDFCAVPGQLCLIKDGNPVIACGDEMLEITDCTVDEISGQDAKQFLTKSLRNRLI